MKLAIITSIMCYNNRQRDAQCCIEERHVYACLDDVSLKLLRAQTATIEDARYIQSCLPLHSLISVCNFFVWSRLHKEVNPPESHSSNGKPTFRQKDSQMTWEELCWLVQQIVLVQVEHHSYCLQKGH